MPVIIIAVVSQKGGAGKTPTAVHLAFALMRMGHRVLFVDADPQATASLHFIGVDYKSVQPTLYNALTTLNPISPYVVNEGLHVLSAHDELARAEIELTTPGIHYQVQLRRLLRKYKNYTVIVIDTPGSTASIFPTLALTAATIAVVPIKTEFASERANGDTMGLIEDVRGTEEDDEPLNSRLKLWGILPTQFEMNVIHHKDVLQSLKDQYKQLVYPEPSRKTNRYSDATALRCDIRDLHPELGDYWDRVAASILEKAGAA